MQPIDYYEDDDFVINEIDDSDNENWKDIFKINNYSKLWYLIV